MLRRRRRSRHRQHRSVPGAVPSTWAARLALLALAIGMVVMHHLVGAHQHSMPDTAASAVADASAQAGGSVMLGSSSTMPTAGHPHAPESTAPGPAALLHDHPDGEGHDVTTLLHMYLAVLVGMALLVVTALVASWWQAVSHRRVATGPAVTVGSRAPPLPLRLAQLQVLRL